jgi:hypothetical protein
MPKWIPPRPEDLKKEYDIEYKLHIRPEYGDIFPTFKSFVVAASKGKIIPVSPSMDGRIGNRSGTRNMDELLSLIKGYRSYPKYRNEKTLAALDKKIQSKTSEMSVPIVLEFPDGELRIMGGNTRMDIGFWYAKTVPVLLVKVPKLKRFGEWNESA